MRTKSSESEFTSALEMAYPRSMSYAKTKDEQEEKQEIVFPDGSKDTQA